LFFPKGFPYFTGTKSAKIFYYFLRNNNNNNKPVIKGVTGTVSKSLRHYLSNISTQHAVGLYWVPVRAGVRGIEIANKPARDGSALKFVRH